ncbi:hypothetical protein DIPPA_18243 [Diplonema papillatum]|nr:hypothetical protein DIPPA_18243 [Diplonema papillatum]
MAPDMSALSLLNTSLSTGKRIGMNRPRKKGPSVSPFSTLDLIEPPVQFKHDPMKTLGEMRLRQRAHLKAVEVNRKQREQQSSAVQRRKRRLQRDTNDVRELLYDFEKHAGLLKDSPQQPKETPRMSPTTGIHILGCFDATQANLLSARVSHKALYEIRRRITERDIATNSKRGFRTIHVRSTAKKYFSDVDPYLPAGIVFSDDGLGKDLMHFSSLSRTRPTPTPPATKNNPLGSLSTLSIGKPKHYTDQWVALLRPLDMHADGYILLSSVLNLVNACLEPEQEELTQQCFTAYIGNTIGYYQPDLTCVDLVLLAQRFKHLLKCQNQQLMQELALLPAEQPAGETALEELNRIAEFVKEEDAGSASEKSALKKAVRSGLPVDWPRLREFLQAECPLLFSLSTEK